MIRPESTTRLAYLVLVTLAFACATVARADNAQTIASPTPTTKPASDDTGAAAPVKYAAGKLLCFLADKTVNESSGLAASRRDPNVFWTHNDSGGKPAIYAFDLAGRDLGTWLVRGAVNRDWEDMASFSLDGKDWLLLADTGDNDRKCKTPRLYLVPEPPVDANRPAAARAGRNATVSMVIPFFYDNGCQDCEAVAVDPNSRTILLIAKRGKRIVYEMPLPDKRPAGPLTAKTIGQLDLGFVTALDISPDGLRAMVCTYGNLVEYTRRPGETWRAAFARRGRMIAAPIRRQGESVCFGHDGKTLYLTSEGSPCPLFRLPVAGSR